MYTIECNHVWKKYTKGEKVYSLRDAIPNLFKQSLKRGVSEKDALSDQEFWVLQDVNFTVEKGEVVGIIGPNGAGKSTILKMLSKIIKPNKGEFCIRGRLSALIEVTAGFHPDFTGRENVYFNGTILGMSKSEIDQKFDEIVDFSGVSEFIDTPVKRYSSGMYARLGFAVAAHVNPEVLLVDEVLAVGDMNFQAKCAQKMRELLKSGTTIVLVSHNIPLVQNICKRVLLFNRGQIIEQGSPEDVIPHYQNLVFKKEEEELAKKFSGKSHRIEITGDSQVIIDSAEICGPSGEVNHSLFTDDSMSIKVNYDAKVLVEDPIFAIKILRSDGVTCCAANSCDNGFRLNHIDGKGSVTVNLGKIYLSAGIYHLEIGVWDREFVHPYAIRRGDIFRIDSPKLKVESNAVFNPPSEWTV